MRTMLGMIAIDVVGSLGLFPKGEVDKSVQVIFLLVALVLCLLQDVAEILRREK
jgi:hypothetical protein